MVQFNLLPDVKLEYIRTTKMKQRVVSIAVIIAAISVGLLIILFLVVNVLQKQHLNNLNNDIQKDIAQLKSTPDLDKILTIQNQLGTLPSLQESTPITSRFYDYLSQLTPTSATIADAEIDFDSQTISISGAADSLTTVNKFVDTIKFTEYTVDGSSDKKKAFSEVVLSEFSKEEKGGVSYSITFKFDPVIFDGTSNVTLVVPSIVTTRSTTEKPNDDLFQQSTTNSGGQ